MLDEMLADPKVSIVTDGYAERGTHGTGGSGCPGRANTSSSRSRSKLR